MSALPAPSGAVRRISQRVRKLERAFLVREGLTGADDKMTGKVTEPIKKGQRVGLTLDEEKFSRLLDEYYQNTGWDVATGIPLKETLEAYGLGDVAQDLRRRNRLG